MSRFRDAWQSLNFDKEYLFGFETSGIVSLQHSKEKGKLEIPSYDPFIIC